jgi:DNA-binding NarL/FixJ family response regulator
MLAEGGETKDIAVRMAIQVSTVRNHVQKILEKLGVHTRLEAVLVAIEQKLVHPRG